MTEEHVKVLPKSPIGQAMAYSLPRWNKLSTYANDPLLNMDNNAVENAIRPIAIGS
ncbi:MAG: family transposase [Segetibacter sp.]|nr:family transposase [Segetibacter sp.]